MGLKNTFCVFFPEMQSRDRNHKIKTNSGNSK